MSGGWLLTTAVATFFVFGKLVILGGTNGEVDVIRSFFTTEELVVLVLYLDLVTACASLALNLASRRADRSSKNERA